MRCDNCGYENAAGVSVCIKCGSALNAASSQPLNEPGGFATSATVFEMGRETDAQPAKGKAEGALERVCECGYPLMPSSKRCPKCGKPVGSGAAPSENTVREEARWENRKEAKQPFSGTVDPYRRQIFHQCRLAPVSREGEKEFQPIVISDSDGVLNRGILDPDNPTISGKEQAELTYRDGKWYVEDKSSHHTTFLHVAEATHIKQGDILLLGDRRFIFEEE